MLCWILVCSKEICDLLSNAAISGFTEYTKKIQSCDPMDAFNAAGEYVKVMRWNQS